LPTYLEEDEPGAPHQRVDAHHREAVEPQRQGAHSSKLKHWGTLFRGVFSYLSWRRWAWSAPHQRVDGHHREAVHCYKNWWKKTSAALGGADQTIRVKENNFDICDGHIWFFSDISDVNSRLFRSFPIMFPVQRMEIPDFSEFSEYIFFSKDGNSRFFGIFRLCFLLKGWKSTTFAMDIFGFFRHFRWRSLEKLNSTAQTGLDPATSGILAHYSTTEPHIYLKLVKKKIDINTFDNFSEAALSSASMK
jgi:hypothetical protein